MTDSIIQLVGQIRLIFFKICLEVTLKHLLFIYTSFQLNSFIHLFCLKFFQTIKWVFFDLELIELAEYVYEY